MDQNKPKDGVSVKEIETFAKKNRFEVFFCAIFILSCFFTFVFFTAWSLIFIAIGGILGVVLPTSVEKLLRTAMRFVIRQERTTQLVLGAVTCVLSIFLPPLIFLLMGLSGGKNLIKLANDTEMQGPA